MKYNTTSIVNGYAGSLFPSNNLTCFWWLLCLLTVPFNTNNDNEAKIDRLKTGLAWKYFVVVGHNCSSPF